jgi:hypothetical protein
MINVGESDRIVAGRGAAWLVLARAGVCYCWPGPKRCSSSLQPGGWPARNPAMTRADNTRYLTQAAADRHQATLRKASDAIAPGQLRPARELQRATADLLRARLNTARRDHPPASRERHAPRPGRPPPRRATHRQSPHLSRQPRPWAMSPARKSMNPSPSSRRRSGRQLPTHPSGTAGREDRRTEPGTPPGRPGAALPGARSAPDGTAGSRGTPPALC